MRDYTEDEICETVFYLARYAECLEIDKAITVPDERELFWMLLDWAREFTRTFEPNGNKDYMTELSWSFSFSARITSPSSPATVSETGYGP